MNEYRQMRMILIYDLPTNEEEDTKNYNRFNKSIKKLGFYMLQYSIYVKIIQNDSNYKQLENKLNKIIPPKGSIVIFKITEKQFQDMIYLRGERNLYENIVGNRELVIFRGDEN